MCDRIFRMMFRGLLALGLVARAGPAGGLLRHRITAAGRAALEVPRG